MFRIKDEKRLFLFANIAKLSLRTHFQKIDIKDMQIKTTNAEIGILILN